jgi:hypothetical protein
MEHPAFRVYSFQAVQKVGPTMKSQGYLPLLVLAVFLDSGVAQAQTPSITGMVPLSPAVTSPGSAPYCSTCSQAQPEPELGHGYTFEILGGTYFRSSHIGPEVPRFDYVPIVFRCGCRPFEDRGFIGERFTLLGELMAAPITGTFGNFLVGPSIVARFDLRDPNCRVVPYFQAGTGFVLTDASHDHTQGAIGEVFEFLQQVEAGVRFRLCSRVDLLCEGGLQHISNAGLARHNLGVNCLGGSMGIRW